MAYPKPPNSRSAVKRAGRAIATGTATHEDLDLVDQWRAAHGYVINTFQAWLRGHISKSNMSIEFAQRLKRKRTVVDKLKRRNADESPLISDVTAMHDHAGCRLIFESIDDMNNFRDYFHSSKVRKNVDHQLKGDKDKYNYISRPKISGYRGIHEVYRHKPRPHRNASRPPEPWDDLLVEIQFRTKYQHAWATAVEISDIIDRERTKFEVSMSDRGRFFALASEYIARRHEGIVAAFQEFSLDELKQEMNLIEGRLKIVERLSALRESDPIEKFKQHSVLSIIYDKEGNPSLNVFYFSNALDAIEKATELETRDETINAVYVRAESPSQLRSAYRNYFNNPVSFVELID